MKKYIWIVIFAVISLFLFSAKVGAYKSANISPLANISEGVSNEENTDASTSMDLEELYRQQNDQAVKNIMIVQFAAIGALLLILGIIFLVSYIQRQKKKKISEQRQAAYDREKKLREEQERSKQIQEFESDKQTQESEKNNNNP